MFTEDININNSRRVVLLAFAFAVLGFAVAFIAAPFILQSVYGIKPGDWNYGEYTTPDGTPKTPYQNLITNACLTEMFAEGDQTVVLDTKGLKEVGLEFFITNPCLDMAFGIAGYKITSIEPYGEDGDMKITLTKN